MKDLRKLTDYEQQRFDACLSLAKEYLSTKQRQKCYLVQGSDKYSDGARSMSVTLPLSDEQVSAIKSQMIEFANKVYSDDPVKSWEEFKTEILDLVDPDYWDVLNEESGAWYDAIFTPLDLQDVIPCFVDFDTVRYLYHFSAYVYETEENDVGGPYKFVQELSDDDYAFLLALQLSVREGFTYNMLFEIDPEFAQLLNRNIDFNFFGLTRTGINTKPFLIIFDEVIEDAKILEEDAKKRLSDVVWGRAEVVNDEPSTNPN